MPISKPLPARAEAIPPWNAHVEIATALPHCWRLRDEPKRFLDIFFHYSGLNIHAGELEVRPPHAPTRPVFRWKAPRGSHWIGGPAVWRDPGNTDFVLFCTTRPDRGDPHAEGRPAV